jgi:hypothetical protein
MFLTRSSLVRRARSSLNFSFAMEAPSAPHIILGRLGDAINQVGQYARPTRGYEPTREAAMAASALSGG